MNINQKNNSNLGDEIKDIIQDVLNTNNFNRLNQDISATVNHALHDVESMFTGKPRYKDPDILWEPLAKDIPPLRREEKDVPPQENMDFGRTQQDKTRKNFTANKDLTAPLRVSTKPPGRVSSVLFLVFGFIGVGIFGFFLATYGVVAALLGFNTTVNGITIGVLLPLFVASSFMAGKGIQIRKRLDRFRRYGLKINGQSYCEIKALSLSIGKTEKFVAADLRKMIHMGYFPYGHIDEHKTCLMLDDDTYKQYLETQKWAKEQKELAERQKEEKIKKDAEIQGESQAQRDLRNTVEEGKLYISQIRKANDDIPGEEVSQKLDRLEAVTSKIFQHIETHPEQIPEIRKFMNYYLPTTLKLTTAYKELDNQPIIGGNITTAKNEIQKTLDTINMAFENLLDNLFYHAAMDISSDISVLETMLAQEGLTNNDFSAKK